MLWIALRLPQLPLEIFQRGMPTPEPFVVATRLQVFACDRKAGLRGIHPGMSLPAAQALSRQLIIRQRDPAAETEALLGLAAWAMQFTPAVAIEFPDMLLLEVSGSLKLLGGLSAIETRMRSQLAELGYSSQIASAPTSRAACWMGNLGAEFRCNEDSLDRTVAALPVTVLNKEAHEGLQAIGATILADVLALPRDGLARRFGQRLLDDIDCALGKLPEARTFFQPPGKFHSCIELAMEVRQSEALIFAARRLFVQLAGFLAARACGVQRMMLQLIHRESVTPVMVSMLSPGRDAMHFTLLLREQLGRISLGEPVQSLSLTADELVPLAGENLALFNGNAEATAQSWQQLVDRLRSRLGKMSVQGISNAEDHRPEHCSIISEPGTRQLELEFAERPFWLLPVPRPLPEVGAVPHHEGPLELLAGPERIESGWWDGQEALRDYFVARSSTQALLWIYRERRPSRLGQWYLHGLFS
jgi:protein ImuB